MSIRECIFGVIVLLGMLFAWIALFTFTPAPGKGKIKLIGIFSAAVLIWFCAGSLIDASKEDRPVGAFAELLVANILFHGGGIAAIGVGSWIGYRVFDRTKNKFMAWTAGIFIGATVCYSMWFVASFIPGVDYRVEEMKEM